MTEIKYKLVDGEPVCDGHRCPQFRADLNDITSGFCRAMLPGRDWMHLSAEETCIPGLRQQRDHSLDGPPVSKEGD